MFTKYENMMQMIGRTPLVRINRMNVNPGVTVYAKLEKFNPGGSVKDRIALRMIEAAEQAGILTKDKTIIEPTSGNTGIGLALVAALKGYRLELVMPKNMSVERKKMLKAYGAKLIHTDATQGMDGAIMLAHKMARNTEKYVMLNQFENEANANAHYETTAKEILDDVPEITVFVAGMGTGGTLMGVSRRLKEHNPGIRIVGVEPLPGHRVQGLKNMDTQMVPKIYDPGRIDEKVNVKDDDAFETARRLVREEGMFVGMSSGAAMHAALKKAMEMEKGTIVVLLADGGEKYISTPLFEK
jgi:cysteine synthase